jgi:hypothetical protein
MDDEKILCHRVPAQMTGFLYQIRCALYLLMLNNDDEQVNISIESFDDIVISKEGAIPVILYQAKHHGDSLGRLTDSSADLWRTLKIWIDFFNTYSTDNTKFAIITTSMAPSNSVASFLKNEEKNIDRVYELLINVATSSKNNSLRNCFDAFVDMDIESAKNLLRKITVIDRNENIVDITKKIKNNLKYVAKERNIDKIFERIEGWWFNRVVELLNKEEIGFISDRELSEYIHGIAEDFRTDNLLIDTEFVENIDISYIPLQDRVFYKQLELISIGSKRKHLAIRDYYRASVQRDNWVKNDLLFINELPKYDKRLIDEWEHLFAQMEDEVNKNDEIEKQEAGHSLYTNIQNKDYRIRNNVSESFVMRGSYHILANKLKVGWHLDYFDILSDKLVGMIDNE